MVRRSLTLTLTPTLALTLTLTLTPTLGLTPTPTPTPNPNPIQARHGHRDVALLLLRQRAAVDAPNGQGTAPLHLAARNGHMQVLHPLPFTLPFTLPFALPFTLPTPLIFAPRCRHLLANNLQSHLSACNRM